MDVRKLITDLMIEIAESTGTKLVDDLTENTQLLKSGLDSLGFAILVSRLEEELKFDPFVEMEQAVYPKTVGEFISIYESRRETNESS